MGMQKPHALLDQMIALRRQKLSMRKIGAALGISKNAVTGALSRAGMCDPDASPVRRRPWEPEEEEALRRLAAAGVPDREIAEHLGRDTRAIKARLHMVRTGGDALRDRRVKIPHQVLRQAPPEGASPSGPGVARQRVGPSSSAGDTSLATAPSPRVRGVGRWSSQPPLPLPRGPIPLPRCCQWPMAMREGRPRHLFCEAPRAAHSPAYCAAHHACAYVQPKALGEAA